MIIELVTAGSGHNEQPVAHHTVRCYNDYRVFAVTDDLSHAISVARLEATSFDCDGFVRIITGSGPGNTLTLTTEPSFLLAKVLLVIAASYLFAALQIVPDIIAQIRCFFATYGNYHGASYRVRLAEEQEQDAPASFSDEEADFFLHGRDITCPTCSITQSASDFQSHGLCNECGKPTCGFCNDGQGHCFDCTPLLALPAGRTTLT